MKSILTAAVLCFALSLSGLAQQNPSDVPATQADVEKYLEAVHSHDMMKQMVDAMSEPMHKMVHERYLKDKDKLPPDFEVRVSQMMDEMLKGMPFGKMMDATVPVYQKHFTKGEIEALTAFYSTPTGQKILHEMPAIMADTMNIIMPMVQEHMAKVSQHVQDEMTAMLKESEKHDSTATQPKRD